MTVRVMSEEEVKHEAVEILLKHLTPAKFVRLLASWQVGKGDYLKIREQLFAEETVETLCEKVEAYQTNKEDK